MATIDVTTYGVTTAASGSTNRANFATALAAAASGDTLYFPAGTYTFDVSGLAGGRAMLVNKSVTVAGAGQSTTTIIADASLTGGVGTNWRLFEITANSVTLRDLTMSGNKPTNPGGFSDYDANVEHHAGVFAGPSISDLTFTAVTFKDFEGDGLQIYTGVIRPTVEYCTFKFNQRSGMSFTPTDPALPVRTAIVRYNYFTGIAGQPVDNEHGPVYGCELYGNTFDSGVNNYAVTCSGYATQASEEVYQSANRSRNWHIYGNTFGQAIFLIRCEDVLIEKNVWNTPHTKPCVDISRSAYNITVSDNDMLMTQTTTGSVAAVLGTGTTEGVGWYPYPDNIYVVNNRITVTGHPSSYGVRMQAFGTVVVSGNTLTGPGASASTFSGIFFRATIAARDCVSATASGNQVYNWGHRGVSIGGNGAAKLLYASIISNKIGNVNGATAMTQGISLDDTTGALQAGLIAENSFGTGITTGIANIPGGATLSFAFPPQTNTARGAAFVGLTFIGEW